LTDTEERKFDHIQISATKKIQARLATTGFEDTYLIHRALPEINHRQIDISTKFFGHKLNAPIIVAAMTGGTSMATKINASLAEAVQQLNLGMGVGSQRAALEDQKLVYTFKVAREKAPNAFLIANIGAPQLTSGYGVDEARKAIKMIEADALAVHFNPLQEVVQNEGQTDFRGALAKVREISHALKFPVIVKETGSGIAAEDAIALEEAGVAGIDVGGAGGTSWAAVEYYRAEKARNELRRRIGQVFWDWGTPTAVSLIEVKSSTKLTVIATGGIRTGVDMAKAIALGADTIGIAFPLLKPAMQGPESVAKELKHLMTELKTAMFLTGAKSIQDLRKVPVVITGKTSDWLKARGFNPDQYARRK